MSFGQFIDKARLKGGFSIKFDKPSNISADIVSVPISNNT
jgi:hypothetical protein